MIRRMTLADVDRVAAAMARAFYDDPLQEWALPDPAGRLGILEPMFAEQARHGSMPLGESYTDDSLSCAAYWAPPGKVEPEPQALAAMGRALAGIVGEAFGRLSAAFQAMLGVHPTEAHFYLQGLGTDPPRQGEGLGSAVMQPVLERCDAEGIPAYLESTKERNVAFYERHGFRVSGTLDIPSGGPRLWLMWRDPR